PAPPAKRERKQVEISAAPVVDTAPRPGTAGIDLPDSTYYGVRQLDVFPALAGGFELRYPARAVAADVKGRVALLVLIDARGVVNDVSVVEAQPPGYFEEAAIRAFREVALTA